MFPEQLDGAKVLYFTHKNEYGAISCTADETAAHIKYLAICKYTDSDKYCLFYCNENKEVETDDLWDSVSECMNMADSFCGRKISWIKK
ncbi:MAG: hypothetical protein K2K57_03985 [Oscillospiraceae bacterium]|nr:hypothetical protein [Oscillospiraceae bacterium]